jgi:hypothetical protein
LAKVSLRREKMTTIVTGVAMTNSSTSNAYSAHLPTPPSERGQWLSALGLGAVGVGVLVAVLTGVVGRVAPPAVLVVAAAPVPSASAPANVLAGVADGRSAEPRVSSWSAAGGAQHGRGPRSAIVARPSSAEAARLVDGAESETPTRWMEGFYPIYSVAQSTFGVNWLLIASIHDQESAFSTAPTTYHGLNFAGCCGGPMQFNVTNGPISTWDLVRDAFRFGKRPAVYDHQTEHHPSIYDDFDSIMAAAWLLSSDGASTVLDDSAWLAAYDYYGHDAAGVAYADEVLARAIGWSQHGFCINCGVDPTLVNAVYEAYGAPVVMATYPAATVARTGHSGAKHRW